MVRQRGFTLIELMIVVLVIAVLGAIAVSSYSEQIRKGRRTSAYNDVAQVQLQLERWRAENPCYGRTAPGGTASGCSTFTESGTYPVMPTDTYYTIALAGTNMPVTYTLTATRKASTAQANDRCGDLTANGNTKPSWGTSSCN
jgi:type IV pilus assembly protein PilE